MALSFYTLRYFVSFIWRSFLKPSISIVKDRYKFLPYSKNLWYFSMQREDYLIYSFIFSYSFLSIPSSFSGIASMLLNEAISLHFASLSFSKSWMYAWARYLLLERSFRIWISKHFVTIRLDFLQKRGFAFSGTSWTMIDYEKLFWLVLISLLLLILYWGRWLFVW